VITKQGIKHRLLSDFALLIGVDEEKKSGASCRNGGKEVINQGRIIWSSV